MKKVVLLITILFLSFNGYSQKKKDLIKEVAQLKTKVAAMKSSIAAAEKAKEVHLEDDLQKFSYSYGVSLGDNLKTLGLDSISFNAFSAGLEDAMKDREKITVGAAQKEVQTTIQRIQDEEAERKSKEGNEFLAENGKRPEVTTTKSGLQYEVLKKGEGVLPKASEKVKVHYTGKLINGKVFDSSVERGEPAIFGVTQVIKGWQEALQIMPVGSKWIVYIPQNLAYGQRGAGNGMIPAYAALVFEMELLEIAK